MVMKLLLALGVPKPQNLKITNIEKIYETIDKCTLENYLSNIKNANEVYKQIKQAYPNSIITVTGHSLGGSLAQLISAENGCQAVTFNAYGTDDILNNAGIYNTKELLINRHKKASEFSEAFNLFTLLCAKCK